MTKKYNKDNRRLEREARMEPPIHIDSTSGCCHHVGAVISLIIFNIGCMFNPYLTLTPSNRQFLYNYKELEDIRGIPLSHSR